MWYPHHDFYGVDFSNKRLQGTAYAICMFLWALARGGRLRSDPYFEFKSSIWQSDITTIRRNVVTIAFEMILFAAGLEAGQIVLTERHSAFGDFFVNAAGIIAMGAVVYVLVALALRTPMGRRIAQLFTTLD